MDIEAMSNTVMDTATAEAYLSYKLLCHRNEPFTLPHLTSILFHITQMSANIPLPVTSAIRAVAFILKKHSVCEIAKATAKQLTSELVPQLMTQLQETLSQHTSDLQATTEPIASSAQQINSTLAPTVEAAERLHKLLKDEREEKEDDARIAADRIEEAVNKLQSSVDDYRTSLKSLTPSLTTTQDRINQLSAQLLSPSQQTIPPTPSQPSYSSIVASHLPPSVDKAVGCAAIRACEILLEPQPDSTLFPPNTSNPDIAKKLKAALTAICMDSMPPGDIRSVASLWNGGIIIELDSECLALWLGGIEGRALLEGQFDSAVLFRNRTFPLVLEYLPIHMQLEQPDFLCKIEHENHLPSNTLSSIRRIKPPLRCSQT
jgi:chaperonin cofactor prefoldin